MEHWTEILLTIIGSGLSAFFGVKAHLFWIIKTLNRHEKYHDDHFNEISKLKGEKHHVRKYS